jgi:hypothetical protein
MRVYNRWAGNPEGTPEDETRCIAEVASRMLFHQCSHRRNGDDNLCGVHRRALRLGHHVSIPSEK